MQQLEHMSSYLNAVIENQSPVLLTVDFIQLITMTVFLVGRNGVSLCSRMLPEPKAVYSIFRTQNIFSRAVSAHLKHT